MAGAKRFKSPCAVRDSVGSTGEMPPVLAGLAFATPSLNALKDALPTLSFDEELSDATRRVLEGGERSIGEEAFAHAAAEREKLRRAARRGGKPMRGDLGYIDKGPEKREEERRPVDASAAGIAADLASFAEAIERPVGGTRPADNRLEWPPMTRRRPGSWDPWD